MQKPQVSQEGKKLINKEICERKQITKVRTDYVSERVYDTRLYPLVIS